MGCVRVIGSDGSFTDYDAIEGWSVMEILRDHGTGVEGTCGGQCDCASCHVYVSEKWLDMLPSMREDEEDKLDELPNMRNTSRLSCQILWEDNLDGLELEIASS